MAPIVADERYIARRFRGGFVPAAVSRRAANLLNRVRADLIEAAGVLRQTPNGQAGYMRADRFDITYKKLAKGVGSIGSNLGKTTCGRSVSCGRRTDL